jgi:hypothetical protein
LFAICSIIIYFSSGVRMRLRDPDPVVFFLISILLPAAAQCCTDRGVN